MKHACLTNTDGLLDDKSPGSDYHLTMLMAPYSLNLVVGEDRQALLKWGRDVWAAASGPAAVLRPMQSEDGRRGYYADAPEFYCDFEQDANGQWSAFFRDRAARKEAFATRTTEPPFAWLLFKDSELYDVRFNLRGQQTGPEAQSAALENGIELTLVPVFTRPMEERDEDDQYSIVDSVHCGCGVVHAKYGDGVWGTVGAAAVEECAAVDRAVGLSLPEQDALRRALMRSAKFVDDDRAHALPPLPEAALRTVENEGGESVYPPYYTADQMLKYARETVDLLVGKRSK